MEGNCKKLEKAQNTALRAILPVWKTTPTAILQKEAATPPTHHTLDYLCKLAALRMHKLEPQHPLCIITRSTNLIDFSVSLPRLTRLIFLISGKANLGVSINSTTLRGSQQLYYTAGITTGPLALFIFFLIFRLPTL